MYNDHLTTFVINNKDFFTNGVKYVWKIITKYILIKINRNKIHIF